MKCRCSTDHSARSPRRFLAFQQKRAGAGQIKMERTRKIASVIRAQLDPYVGAMQINLVGVERWANYPFWRQEHGKGRVREAVSGSTIRHEMSIFRAIMAYAAGRKYIPTAAVFDGKLQVAKERREEFNPDEYRKLHTFARSWLKQASKPSSIWYRTIAYNFVLIMCNTGMGDRWRRRRAGDAAPATATARREGEDQRQGHKVGLTGHGKHSSFKTFGKFSCARRQRRP